MRRTRSAHEFHVHFIDRCYKCEYQLIIRYPIISLALTSKVAALPVGILLDSIGPRWASLIGAVLFTAGNFVFGLGVQHDQGTRFCSPCVILGSKLGSFLQVSTAITREMLCSAC